MEEPMLKVDKRDMAVVEQFDLEWIGYIMLGSMEVALFGSSSFYDAATPEVKAAMYQILSKNNRVPKKKDKLTKAI